MDIKRGRREEKNSTGAAGESIETQRELDPFKRVDAEIQGSQKPLGY
jgi:hypothetical protein